MKTIRSFGSKSSMIIGLTGESSSFTTTCGKDGSLSVQISIQVCFREWGGAIGV